MEISYLMKPLFEFAATILILYFEMKWYKLLAMSANRWSVWIGHACKTDARNIVQKIYDVKWFVVNRGYWKSLGVLRKRNMSEASVVAMRHELPKLSCFRDNQFQYNCGLVAFVTHLTFWFYFDLTVSFFFSERVTKLLSCHILLWMVSSLLTFILVIFSTSP